MNNVRTFIQLLDAESRKRVFAISILLLIAGPAEVIGLGCIVLFIGVVANPDYIQRYQILSTLYEAGQFTDIKGFITALGVTMVLTVALSNILLAILAYVDLRLAWSLHYRLSVRLTEAYLGKDLLWFLGQNTSELSKNILGEVHEVIHGILKPALGLTTNLFRVILFAIFLITVEPRLAIGVFILGGSAFSWLVWYTQARLVEYGEERRSALRIMYKQANEMLSGVKELKLFQGEEYLMRSFAQGVKRLGRSELTVGLVKILPQYFFQTLALVGTLAIALILFYTGSGNEEVFTTLGVFAIGGYRMMSASQRVFANYSSIRFGSATLKNIKNEISELRPQAIDQEPITFEEKIELKNVTFSYPGQEEPVLKDLSLTIPQHTKVAFVGSTGAGKTTILNLLLGLLEPSSGTMEVDGYPITSANRRGWQRILGYVPQDIFLLDDTVVRNIAFAVPDSQIDRNAVEEAARTAQLDNFICNELTDGYDTLIGERGARLSGGQRQRIGIARALFRQPKVLVLDEATSALDGATESAVVDGVETTSEKKTVLVVAHRLTTVKTCDVIHVLRDGYLVSSGSYDELMEACGEFRRLAGEGDLLAEEG